MVFNLYMYKLFLVDIIEIKYLKIDNYLVIFDGKWI